MLCRPRAHPTAQCCLTAHQSEAPAVVLCLRGHIDSARPGCLIPVCRPAAAQPTKNQAASAIHDEHQVHVVLPFLEEKSMVLDKMTFPTK